MISIGNIIERGDSMSIEEVNSRSIERTTIRVFSYSSSHVPM